MSTHRVTAMKNLSAIQKNCLSLSPGGLIKPGTSNLMKEIKDYLHQDSDALWQNSAVEDADQQ